jgi:uncharacterized protein YegL
VNVFWITFFQTVRSFGKGIARYFRNGTENKISNVNQIKDLVYLSKTKGEIIKKLMKKVSASMDKKTGILSVSAQLPNPLVSAQVAK